MAYIETDRQTFLDVISNKTNKDDPYTLTLRHREEATNLSRIQGNDRKCLAIDLIFLTSRKYLISF